MNLRVGAKVSLGGLLLLSVVRFVSFRGHQSTLFGTPSPAVQNRSVVTLEPPPAVNCLERRGSSGTWVQDWEYANRTNYKMHGSYTTFHIASKKFQPTAEQPFRLATSWRWQDDTCPVHEISLTGFCRACAKLDLTRILILGDSLSMQFGYSILSLLGFPPQGRRNKFGGIQRPFYIPCKVQQQNDSDNDNNSTTLLADFDVTIWVYRRSALKDLKGLRTEAESNGTMNGNKYRAFVQDNPNTTAIIANTGAWMKSWDNFTYGFDSIVQWVDSFPEPTKILAFWRPTIPGHYNCLPTGNDTDRDAFDWKSTIQQGPYRDYAEYAQATRKTVEMAANNGTTTDLFNWLDFEDYNAYSRAVFANRTAASKRAHQFHWMNIFNSSVLRRDGHVGFGDCSHFSLPGPPDWWVHFFYSMLLDLSAD